jgi:hypothetical protein
MGRGAVATALGLAALAVRCADAQSFTTDLKGLGGSPIGLTPLNAPDVSVMDVNFVGDSDPEVRSPVALRACVRCARAPASFKRR